MTFTPVPTTTSGGQPRVETVDDAIVEILRQVLIELRKANIYNAYSQDIRVEDKDVKE